MAKQTKWTIYCHIHRESGRRYVGLTRATWRQRWNRHVYSAKKVGGVGYSHFAAAIRKYGKNAFDHEVLQVCPTLEEANAAEQHWIWTYGTRDPLRGFNLTPGGAHVPHSVRNPWDDPEFRKRGLEFIAKANALATPEVRSSRSKELWGRPEFRESVEPILRHNMTDPILKEKAVASMKASFARPESREKRSAASKALWESEEFRARNSELWKDPEFRERCGSGLLQGASLNASKTHCKNGHEFTSENTHVNKRGSRECRTCVRSRGRESARKRYRDQRSGLSIQ